MATFAATFPRDVIQAGGLRVTFRTVTFSSSYSTGGETVNPGDVGQTSILFAVPTVKTATAGAVANASYDVANSKLKALTTTAEVSAATNLSGVSVDVAFFGPN